MHAQVELSDGIHKFKNYLTKISQSQNQNHIILSINNMNLNNNSSSKKSGKNIQIYNEQQLQKICQLAYEVFNKYSDSDQFTKLVYESIKKELLNCKSYFMLYLMDQILKNSKPIMKIVKKELQGFFKQVWQRTFQNQKYIRNSNKMKINLQNSHQKNNSIIARQSSKLQNLKLMAKTWGKIYGQKYQNGNKAFLKDRYNVDLNDLNPLHLKKLEEIYDQKQQRNDKDNNTSKQTLINLKDRLQQLEQQEQKIQQQKQRLKKFKFEQQLNQIDEVQSQKQSQRQLDMYLMQDPKTM